MLTADLVDLDTTKAPEPPVAALPSPLKSKSATNIKPLAKKGAAKTSVVPKKEEPKVLLTRAWPLTIGEKSSYNLRWGVIEGGVAKIEVKPPQILAGTPVLHYSGIVKSSKMMNMFYKIDNSIDTWVRLSDLAPIRQEIKQIESARYGRRVMVIDPEKNEVKFYEKLTKTKGGTKEDKRVDSTAIGAQDIFGALYFYRFVQTIEGDYKFPVHDKGKNWFAELKFEDRETVRIPAGVFQARRYKVAPRLEGQLKPKGDVYVWVSDDDRNLLLKFNAKIRIGSITGELVEHTPGQAISMVLPSMLTPVEELSKTVSAKD